MGQVEPRVTLVRGTPDPGELIASAASLCYAGDVEHILEKKREKSADLVRRLTAMGHMSPIEHASFTFYIEGVSQAMTHQPVRHRIASYSQ